MNREITDHKLNGLNAALDLNVIDEPGHGGASHEYKITLKEGKMHNFVVGFEGTSLLIPFQKGSMQESGVNGISGEVLLATVIDRLRSFQAGSYACQDNADALLHLEQALACLQKRTKERLERGVEGMSAK